MIHQLRINEIFERNKAAFHARFRDHASRIMARHGFRILSMWETRSAGRTWLRSKGNSIEGGTSEINLNVVSKRVLGLPDPK